MLKIYTNNLFYSFNFSTYVLVASHVLVAFFPFHLKTEHTFLLQRYIFKNLSFSLKSKQVFCNFPFFQVPLKCPLSNKGKKTCIHSFTILAKILSDNVSPRPIDREASKYFKGLTLSPKKAIYRNLLS